MMLSSLSQRTEQMQPSLIRAIADRALGQKDVIPLMFGEGCWPTSDIAVHALQDALASNDHFYHPNSGKPSLRRAIADYQSALYNNQTAIENITVTASGMQALALTAQALISQGDRIIYIDPVWPNLPEVFKISGAETQPISLYPHQGRWQLDLDQLLSMLDSQIKAVLINSPNNPTGWVMSEEEQQALLAHCRHHGIWIITDEVYARLCRGRQVAPSFQHIASPDDRIISINSFSKAWSMTGWRLGWISAPAELETVLASLTEFNIACPAGSIQAAGEAMLKQGENEVHLLQHRIDTGFQIIKDRLGHHQRISFIEPDGAFYVLFGIDGFRDSLELAFRILEAGKVGLAPGAAFGPAAEGHLRLCYAQEPDKLKEACDRLDAVLNRL